MSTDDPRSLHMSADDFRRHGHAMIDWIADYLDGGVEAHPVQSRATPGQVFESLPAHAPEAGEPFDVNAMLASGALPPKGGAGELTRMLEERLGGMLG